MAAPVTTTWTPRTVTLGIRLTAVLTPILVTATPPTSTNPARQLTSRVTGRRLTLLADRGSSRAPAFFVAVPPHAKGGRHSGPLFPYLLVSENSAYETVRKGTRGYSGPSILGPQSSETGLFRTVSLTSEASDRGRLGLFG